MTPILNSITWLVAGLLPGLVIGYVAGCIVASSRHIALNEKHH